MQPELKPGRFAFATLIIGGCCIAFAPILVRISELPPTATAFHRMMLALPLFAGLMLQEHWAGGRAQPSQFSHEKKASLPAPKSLQLLVLSGLLFAGDLAIWHWSIAYTSIANATLLANFSPIFVTTTAWFFFRERITWPFIIGMILALSGAAILMQTSLDFGAGRLLGDTLALVASIFYAGYLISVKILRQWMATWKLMGYSSLITCLALFFITILAGEQLIPFTPTGWLVLLALAWISQVAGQGLIAYALAHLPVSFSSVTLLIQPLAAALLAWVILGESLSWWQGFGGLTVLTGIMLARRSSPG